MKVHDVFDDGKSSVYFVMDRMHHDLLDGLLAGCSSRSLSSPAICGLC